jgi:serine/threonine protein kinase
MSEKDIDHRTDIWAFGVIMFEVLVGERPLLFENLGQMYTLFLQGEVPPIRERLPELDADVADLIERCLQKDRADRLDDLQPLIDALARRVDARATADIGRELQVMASATTMRGTKDPVAATRHSEPPKRGSWKWMATVAGLVVLGLVGVSLPGNEIDSTAESSETESPAPTATPAAQPPTVETVAELLPAPSASASVQEQVLRPRAQPLKKPVPKSGTKVTKPSSSVETAKPAARPKGISDQDPY